MILLYMSDRHHDPPRRPGRLTRIVQTKGQDKIAASGPETVVEQQVSDETRVIRGQRGRYRDSGVCVGRVGSRFSRYKGNKSQPSDTI
jgi:hypothetical protein